MRSAVTAVVTVLFQGVGGEHMVAHVQTAARLNVVVIVTDD
jgi:hypothetical protein